MKTNRFSESFANADAVFNDMYGVELKLQGERSITCTC